MNARAFVTANEQVRPTVDGIFAGTAILDEGPCFIRLAIEPDLAQPEGWLSRKAGTFREDRRSMSRI